MIDQELTVEIVCEVQALNLELKKEKEKHREDSYDELGY